MSEHERQQAFREILDGMAFPGKVKKIQQSCSQISGLLPLTSLVCETLLDREVRFAVLGDEHISDSLHAYTGSRAVEMRVADFIIIPYDAPFPEKLTLANVGTLENPHQSATIIYEISSLSEGNCYELTGPGIKEKKKISAAIPRKFIENRNELNKEYPLGIDVIFIDQHQHICAFPRTTNIVEVDVSWDM